MCLLVQRLRLDLIGADYVDLFWIHAWDGVTPAHELLETVGDSPFRQGPLLGPVERAGPVRGATGEPGCDACEVATEIGQSPARVALSWVARRESVRSVLMGASRVEQVSDNIAALELSLSDEHRARLDAASAPDTATLYSLFTPEARQHVVFGGKSVVP